ncbi:MAG: hypothetical protein JWQ63_1183 [Mucilaginibacter sp.]|nr:hypothetical protein [Mucilaginibacter sp.]
MKQLIFTIIIGFAVTGVFAQNTNSDSSKTITDTLKTKKDKNIRLGYGEDAAEFNFNKDRKDVDSVKYNKPEYPKFSIGVTFSRFDLGFATLIDNGSFTLQKQNQFLRYNQWKTSNVGFDVLQMGVRFSSSFKIYLSGGFDWTLIRLRDNITILPNQPTLTFRPDNINYSKNRFSSSYLRIPLSFDFRTREAAGGNRFHFVFGPDVGFLINGRVKQVSEENGKQKFDDTYHFATFRYGAFARIGYGDFGIFAKYYFNDMFENSPQQAGIKNFSFGLTVGF